MNEYLKKLTPLDSSQLEVFLRIFWDFSMFWNSNLKFEFGPVWNRSGPVRPVTAVTGPVPAGFFNPGQNFRGSESPLVPCAAMQPCRGTQHAQGSWRALVLTFNGRAIFYGGKATHLALGTVLVLPHWALRSQESMAGWGRERWEHLGGQRAGRS